MERIIGVTELQRNFRAVLDEIRRRHIPYVVTRGSRPEAALLPYEEYLRFQELQEKEVLAQFDRLTTRMAAKQAETNDEEVARDIEAARSEVSG